MIGRRLSFGSDSEAGTGFTAMMYSVLGTLASNGIDPLHWLDAWLTACAQIGGRAPGDLTAWLPWSMSADRGPSCAQPPCTTGVEPAGSLREVSGHGILLSRA